MTRKSMGRAGEAAAAQFLTSKGYRIVAANVRPLPGLARGEIDIIAWDGDILCFIEVKARRARSQAPDLSVTLPKRRQITILAEAYMSVENIEPRSCRFDVVSVWLDPSLPTPMLTLLQNAFDPE
jgi:putative endonuclease